MPTLQLSVAKMLTYDTLFFLGQVFCIHPPYLVRGLTIITQTWMQLHFIRKSGRVKIIWITMFVFALMQIFL